MNSLISVLGSNVSSRILRKHRASVTGGRREERQERKNLAILHVKESRRLGQVPETRTPCQDKRAGGGGRGYVFKKRERDTEGGPKPHIMPLQQVCLDFHKKMQSSDQGHQKKTTRCNGRSPTNRGNTS